MVLPSARGPGLGLSCVGARHKRRGVEQAKAVANDADEKPGGYDAGGDSGAKDRGIRHARANPHAKPSDASIRR